MSDELTSETVEYGKGYRDGYNRARAFYGFTAPEALQRIAEATAELQTQIKEGGGRMPTALRQYFDTVEVNTRKKGEEVDVRQP